MIVAAPTALLPTVLTWLPTALLLGWVLWPAVARTPQRRPRQHAAPGAHPSRHEHRGPGHAVRGEVGEDGVRPVQRV